MDGSPRAVGPPRLGYLADVLVSAVLLGDLVGEALFVARHDVRRVGPPQDHQLGAERPEALDLAHTCEGLVGMEGTQHLGVESSLESGARNGVHVLGLAAGQIQIQGPQTLWCGEGTTLAVELDEVVT